MLLSCEVYTVFLLNFNAFISFSIINVNKNVKSADMLIPIDRRFFY